MSSVNHIELLGTQFLPKLKTMQKQDDKLRKKDNRTSRYGTYVVIQRTGSKNLSAA